MTQDDWISGYGAASILFLEMLFYCLVGTLLENAVSRHCANIFTAKKNPSVVWITCKIFPSFFHTEWRTMWHYLLYQLVHVRFEIPGCDTDDATQRSELHTFDAWNIWATTCCYGSSDIQEYVQFVHSHDGSVLSNVPHPKPLYTSRKGVAGGFNALMKKRFLYLCTSQ